MGLAGHRGRRALVFVAGALLSFGVACGGSNGGAAGTDSAQDPKKPSKTNGTPGSTTTGGGNSPTGGGTGTTTNPNAFPEGCTPTVAAPASGANCTATCVDCGCTSIKYECNKTCYTSTPCLINATPDGTAHPSSSLSNGCGALSCVPENDLTEKLSCTATQCQPEPAQQPTQTPGVCQGGMECKPGSIRYCDDSSIAEWTKSTCDATGHWGACVATTAPQGDGCEPDSYSPEVCCPPLGLCCQNDDGPFVDFGSGGCAAIACQ